MKKICFLSAMLIAVNGLVSAQTSYNFNAGTGVWIVNTNPKSFDGQTITKPGVAPTLFVGASASKTFESNFVASIGADFHFLFSNGAYKTNFDYVSKSENAYEAFWWDDSESDGLGHAECAANCYVFSLPIRVGYQIGKFTPNIGFEYGLRLNDNKADLKKNTMSLTAGLEYQLSPKFALTLNYSKNMVGDMNNTARKVLVTCEETEDGSVQTLTPLDSEKVTWHSQRVEVGISYRLGKSAE